MAIYTKWQSSIQKQSAGAQRWTRTIQGAFCSLTPEMGTWAARESLPGPTLSQRADLQAHIEALGPYTIYTDGGWEYGMDAPFYQYTDSPSHKGGGSVVFITTDLTRLKTRHRPGVPAMLSYVAIRIDQGEEVGRGPNPQELLALLVALGM